MKQDSKFGYSHLVCLVFGMTFFFSCGQNKEMIPSAAFAPYISAYTGGMVSTASTIRIELTQAETAVELNTEMKQELFRFSPSLKGKSYWVNNKTIEFVPDSGQLKPGTVYRGDFRLGEIRKVDSELETFRFSFRVKQRDFVVDWQPLDIYSGSPDRVTLKGKIRFSDRMTPTQVEQMISVGSLAGQTIKAVIETKEASELFSFVIPDVKRGAKDESLEITVSGKPVGVEREEKQTIEIPALKPFRFLSARMIDLPENGLELTFSDPVSAAQDLTGLISIPEISGYVFQVQDNKVRVYFEKPTQAQLTLQVREGIRNEKEESLSAPVTVSLSVASPKPAVEIPYAGTILPDSKNLILPFRAVNLSAVDLKVIRIYESNILSFLQSNTLKTATELRRSGRLVHQETLHLDADPIQDLHAWGNYSIDLSKLFRQEPGAIYQISLSFKREYSVYPCGGEVRADAASKEQPQGMIPIVPQGLTEREDSIWDEPSAYYYDYPEIDWSVYDWKESDNPCHPSYFMGTNRTASCNVMSSNLGVIAKGNGTNQLWITVTDLLTTKPVEKALVTVYNYQLQPLGSVHTDEKGFARMDSKGKPFVLVAEFNKQKTYLRLVDGEENLTSRFDVGGKETLKGLKGYLYGERGVWRPGDTLHLTFILNDREHRIPPAHPVSLELYNPRGQFQQKQVSTGGLNGFYTFAVPTSPEDPTGSWNAYVKVGGTAFHRSLRIETVKPNRLKIHLDLPAKRLNASDGSIPVSLHSSWLTGATARNLDAKVELSLTKEMTAFKGYENYLFTNPAVQFTAGRTDVFSGKLDENGKVNFALKLPAANNAPGMLTAHLTCRVFEGGGDASLFTQTIPFSPYPSYVGVNLNQNGKDDSYIETDTEHTFDVVTLNADGQPVNRSGLEYKIYKIDWSWWWEQQKESLESYVNNTSAKPVESGTLATVGGRAKIKFKVSYPEWGRYLVYVKDPVGGHASGGTVYVDWPSWRGRSNKTDPDGITMLAFSTDRTEYEVGQEATVLIPSPAAGRALVALENGSTVLKREWIQVSGQGDTKYTFKITPEMAPNCYLHISLLQPHAQTVNDLPIRMYGVIPVFVTDKASKLKPKLSLPDVLRPEQDFTVRVQEQNGKPMTYTLAVVDDGLLDLTNFKTPDPWSEFYAREALGVRTWDMFDYVIGAFGGKYGSLFSIGGDEALKPVDTKANRFKPVVKFYGPFALGKGQARTHTVRLPSYIGSVRVMLVAGQDGAYGQAEKTVPVRTPLMVLPTLPRVVSTGEEIQLPVTVFAMEDRVKNVYVSIRTGGKLKVAGSNSQPMRFDRPGDRMAFFTLHSGAVTGVEKVTVTASGEGVTSKETLEIEVRNPNPPVVSMNSRLLKAGEKGELPYQLAPGSSPADTWLKLEVSRIPSVDLSRRYDFLYEYPHYCTEQLISCALPLLFVRQLKDLDVQEAEAIRTNIPEAIRNLYGRQLPTGGMVYWPGASVADEWISSYAGVFWTMAKEGGYAVNEGAVNRWKAFQRRAAQNWSATRTDTRYAYSQNDLLQAYRLYSLALAGAPERGAMNRLKEQKDLSLQSKWLLAATYALSGNKQAGNELIFRAQTDVKSYPSMNPTYGSSLRDEAIILEAFVLLGRQADAFKQAQKLSARLSQEGAFETQSTAFALVAMGRLAGQSAGAIDYAWSLNGIGQKPVQSAKAVYETPLAIRPASGQVTFTNRGKGMLYVNLVSRSRPVTDHLPAQSEGLRLTIRYTDLKGAPVTVEKLQQGADFVAVVEVANTGGTQDYANLALTHILPSGWEIFNDRLIFGTTETEAYSYQDIRDDRVLTYFDLGVSQSKTFRIRLQASYAGTFTLPAIQCEAMYNPNVRARTAAGKVMVVR